MTNNNELANEMWEKSNYDLQQIVNRYPKVDKDRVLAALYEMKNRNILYHEEKELLNRLEDTPAETEWTQSAPGGNYGPFAMFRDPNIVEDQKAPQLYSRYAIRFFAILFSTLFGGILLGINLSRLGKKTEIFIVAGFSFIYSYGVYYIGSLMAERTPAITLIMNLIGAVILVEVFWNRYIGKDTKFRRQSVMGVLLIGFGISIILLMAMF